MKNLDSSNEQRIKDCYKKHGKGYAILGDSHAFDLFGIITYSSSSPFILHYNGSCNSGCNYDEFLDFTRENSNIFFGVIYEQAGTDLLVNAGTLFTTPYGEELNNIYPNEKGIQNVYAFLKKLSAYTKVVWFGSRIEPRINDKMILRRGCDYDFKLRPNQREIFEELDAFISKMIVDQEGLRFVSQNIVFR